MRKANFLSVVIHSLLQHKGGFLCQKELDTASSQTTQLPLI